MKTASGRRFRQCFCRSSPSLPGSQSISTASSQSGRNRWRRDAFPHSGRPPCHSYASVLSQKPAAFPCNEGNKHNVRKKSSREPAGNTRPPLQWHLGKQKGQNGTAVLTFLPREGIRRLFAQFNRSCSAQYGASDQYTPSRLRASNTKPRQAIRLTTSGLTRLAICGAI